VKEFIYIAIDANATHMYLPGAEVLSEMGRRPAPELDARQRKIKEEFTRLRDTGTRAGLRSWPRGLSRRRRSNGGPL
jgi:hypothetical protein